jgi:hypothetical protein
MKQILEGNSFNDLDTIKLDKMIEVKKKNKIGLTLLDDSIDDYYKDSNLGGSKLIMSFNGHSVYNGHFFNDSRIRNIEFGIDLKPGFLSWVELWRIIDDFVLEYQIDKCEILYFDAFELENFFSGIQKIVKPKVIGL